MIAESARTDGAPRRWWCGSGVGVAVPEYVVTHSRCVGGAGWVVYSQAKEQAGVNSSLAIRHGTTPRITADWDVDVDRDVHWTRPYYLSEADCRGTRATQQESGGQVNTRQERGEQ